MWKEWAKFIGWQLLKDFVLAVSYFVGFIIVLVLAQALL